jgi:ATP-dependent DNA ligase
MLEQHHTAVCPFANPPRINRLVYWCEPQLVCQVRAGEPSPSGELRFAVFAALRPDLSPEECILDRAG